MSRRQLAPGLAVVAALALGIAAADAARRAPGFSLAGDSLPRLILGVAAGWAVVAGGLALGAGGARASGNLLAASGCAWLAAGLATPGARAAPLFTLGLVCVAAAPALAGHALLVAGREGPVDRFAAVALYASLVGLLGVLTSLFFDPVASGCAGCPANLLQVADSPDAVADLSRWGIRLGLVATAGTAALALWRLARAPVARRLRAAPVVVPGSVFLALVGAGLAHSWDRGFLGTDSFDQALWTGQALALVAVATGVALLHAQARRRRSRLARMVVELAGTQRPGGLRDALADLLGDPDLELLHASPGEHAWIDAAGRVRTPPPGAATTPLVREGEPVALLCHRPGLLDDPRTAVEIERSVRLGLEHERLEGGLRRQLAQLRRSRADLVAAGEAERRLLERDLHDGAQQGLVAFAFSLGIARRHAAPDLVVTMDHAAREVHDALAELRELAHGLYPVALAEAGLAAAVESLGDRRPGLRASSMPAERFAPAVEETAYFVIAGMADQWSPQPVELDAVADTACLVLELHAPAGPPSDLVDVEDRVGALGGTLAVEAQPSGHTRVRVELPCA